MVSLSTDRFGDLASAPLGFGRSFRNFGVLDNLANCLAAADVALDFHDTAAIFLQLLDDVFEDTSQRLQAHVEHVRHVRNNRLYGEVLGGVVFEGISRLRRGNESPNSDAEGTNRLHDAFRDEVKKLSHLDPEITRDEESLKSYLAESLGNEDDNPPERLLERAIRAVRELNEGKVVDAPSDKTEING